MRYRDYKPNNAHIRVATTNDIPTIAALMRDYWSHDHIDGFDLERVCLQLTELFAHPEFGRAWVAECDDRIVAYLLVTFIYSFEHGGLMAEIDELYVSAEWRGHNIGTQLIANACENLAQAHCKYLQMQVSDDNAAAQSFYRKLGFREKAGYRLWLAPLSEPGP